MKILKNTHSRLSSIDFDNLQFGKQFTDHMLVCEFDGAAWQEPEIRPYGPVEMDPSLHVLHYGQAIFEGMKAFKDVNGEVKMFRPQENFRRFNVSAERMCMPQVPEEVFMDGLKALLDLERAWVPEGQGKSLYIRPLMFGSSHFIKADASEQYTFMIICSPTASYFTGEVRLKVEEKYTRAAPGGTGFAKTAGNYAASFYPVRDARKQGYTQVLWTDGAEHKYLEECGTMNMFFRVDDALLTPSLSDSILPGITRKSIIQLAKDAGIVVEERRISIAEIFEAYHQGRVKEAFGVGTAAVVSPVSLINYQEKDMVFSHDSDSFALQLKQKIVDIQQGRIEDLYGWMITV